MKQTWHSTTPNPSTAAAIIIIRSFLYKDPVKRKRSARIKNHQEMAGTSVFYSDGEWKRSTSGNLVSIINPTTRKTQYKVQACTQEEVNKIIEAAKTAQKSWAKTPLWKRAELLHKAAAILKEHRAPIAECLVKEIAKPAKDAVTEAVRSGDLVSYCAEEGVRILGEGKFSGV
ncbi:hypothetical protein NC652_039115 [Populus alba x Populus x berolinensis]|nr:hypothetical protein NC652_039115 [Populus alba x Populus x berolinensis]